MISMKRPNRHPDKTPKAEMPVLLLNRFSIAAPSQCLFAERVSSSAVPFIRNRHQSARPLTKAQLSNIEAQIEKRGEKFKIDDVPLIS